MKRFIILICALAISSELFAQLNETEYNFYYISHDRNTPVQALCTEIQDIYKASIVNKRNVSYLYLANADTPVIVKCNERNMNEVNLLINEIYSRSEHAIFPEYDLKRIVEIIDKDDFVDKNGVAKYDYVTFRFYINPSFWMNAYQEMLVSRLAFILESDKLSNCIFDMIHHSSDTFKYEVDGMFGAKELIKPFECLTY